MKSFSSAALGVQFNLVNFALFVVAMVFSRQIFHRPSFDQSEEG